MGRVALRLAGGIAVGPLAVVVGCVMIVLGVGGYVASDMVSPTALIPAGLGVLLVVFGVVARNEKMRMHAMHGAVLVGLIGFIMGAVLVVLDIAGDKDLLTLRFGMKAAMGLICGVFVGLCIKSFIDARRRRQGLAADQRG